MTDRTPMPGSAEDDLSREPGGSETAREAALTLELLRLQERHREGGVDRDLVLGPEGEDGAGSGAVPPA